MKITTLGIDLAKSVFQLHGVDADGTVVLQKKLRRGAVLDFLGKLEPCLIGMEACPSSHFWAREIAALGHDVRLICAAHTGRTNDRNLLRYTSLKKSLAKKEPSTNDKTM